MLSPEEIDNERALHMYGLEQYADAARAFRKLWEEYRSARYLYNAALSHEALGHYAYAYVYFRRYLIAQDRVADREATALRRVSTVKARTGVILVQFPPGTDLATARVIIHYHSFTDRGDPNRPPLELEAAELERSSKPDEVLVHVELGYWHVTPMIPGSLPLTYKRSVIEPNSPILVRASTKPPRSKPMVTHTTSLVNPMKGNGDVVDERAVRRMSGAFKGIGVLTLAGGTGVLIYSGVRWNRDLSEFMRQSADHTPNSGIDVPWNNAGDILFKDWKYQAASAGVLGGGAGLGIVGAIAQQPRRPRAWIAPLLIGGMSTAGGLYGVAVLTGQFNAEHGSISDGEGLGMDDVVAERHQLQQMRMGLMSSGAAAGLGVGLFVGSLIGILHPETRRARLKRNYSLQPKINGREVGLVLQGRF